VDLQGVENILTDPALHSRNRIFEDTDFGLEGFAKFLKTHKCNNYC